MTAGEDAIRQMQGGLRAWVQRAARQGEGGLRRFSPSALLSLLCASSFAPLLAVGAGVTGEAAVAGIGVLSSVGSGVLSGVLASAVDRMRSEGEGPTVAGQEVENGIAEQIRQALDAGGERAADLQREIAVVLGAITASETVLQAAFDTGNEQFHKDIIAAIGVLEDGFADLGFLIRDVGLAAAEIRERLDEQAANVRDVVSYNRRQSVQIRVILEMLTAMQSRSRPGASAAAGSGRGTRWESVCPYRGLVPFDEDDGEVFYGRQRLTAELALMLQRRITSGRMVVVTGASGAGKTSLLRAGLLPALARGAQVPGSGHWRCVMITPTEEPLTELAAALAGLGHDGTATIRDRLAQHPDRAYLIIQEALAADGAGRQYTRGRSLAGTRRLVLIVDQFEQVFTSKPGAEDEAGRQAFIEALCAAAAGHAAQAAALVVIAVRGDFWDRCAADPRLAPQLQHGQFVVGPMTEPELRLAITGPAEAAGLGIDAALIDTIIGELRAAPGADDTAGALPLLSQAMLLTWENREGNRLTVHGYELAGGVSSAVQASADAVYDALGAQQQALARDILRSMTTASRDGTFTRRPLNRAGFCATHPGTDRSQVDAVLEAFAAKRLIVLNDGTAQIAHDILLSAWPKLHGWLEDDLATLILYGQFADDAAAWHDHDDDPSYLWRGTQLVSIHQAIKRWSADPQRYPVLTSLEQAFLLSSDRAVARSNHIRLAVRSVLPLLAVAVLVVALLAGLAARNANHQRDLAIASQVAAEADELTATDQSLAAQLDLVANQISPTPDNQTRLINTTTIPLGQPLTGPAGSVNSVAFSSDRRTLAAGSEDGKVWLWNLANPAHLVPLGQLPTGEPAGVISVAFSKDGRTLAAGTGLGDVWLWNLADPARPAQLGQPLTGPASFVNSVAFSPDGRILAAGTEDKTVWLWNLTDPARPAQLAQPLTGPADQISSVAFSKDGRTLAVGSDDKRVWLWNLTDPARPAQLAQPLTGPADQVSSVAFSPDGRTVAAGSDDGKIWLWNLADPARPARLAQPLTGSPGTVTSVAFSKDGRTLAAALCAPGHYGILSGGGSAASRPTSEPAISRYVTGSLATALKDPNYPASTVAFGPDAKTLAVGGDNTDSDRGATYVWDLAARTITATLTGPGSNGVRAVAFAPGGTTLATGDSNGSTYLWDLATRTITTTLTDPGGAGVDAVAFGPGGTTLATGDSNGSTYLWDLATGKITATLTGPGGNRVNAVVFGPGGKMLAVGSGDYQRSQGATYVWDLATGKITATLTDPGGAGVDAVAFGPGGTTLASGDFNGSTYLWDLATGKITATLTDPGSAGVMAIALAPGGTTLAVGDNDGSAYLWDLATRTITATLIDPGGNQVDAVAFGPGGTTLAIGDENGSTYLWSVASHTS